ncbi:MAG: arginase family protein, partial [Nanobdellota archaeon]
MAKTKLISIPQEAGNMNKNTGCSKAPDKIIEELGSLFLTEDGENTQFSQDSVEIAEDDFEKTNRNIYEKIKENERCIILGGDHSITYPCVKAFSEKSKHSGLIMLDAHPDCESDFMPPSHEDLIRGLVNNKDLK